MDALLFLVVMSLLIIVGVVSSVRLYKRGALGTGRFRRIRRVRTRKPLPDGTVIEEKVEEVIDEEAPVEEGIVVSPLEEPSFLE
jgi:hypothetical protein